MTGLRKVSVKVLVECRERWKTEMEFRVETSKRPLSGEATDCKILASLPDVKSMELGENSKDRKEVVSPGLSQGSRNMKRGSKGSLQN